MPPRTRASRPSRLSSGRKEPVTVRQAKPQPKPQPKPQTFVDIGHIALDPLPQRDIPSHLRTVHPVAASVAYRLADGRWDRVQVAEDGRSVMVK